MKTPKIEQRIQSILNPQARRRGVTLVELLAIGAGAVALIPLVALRPAVVQEPPVIVGTPQDVLVKDTLKKVPYEYVDVIVPGKPLIPDRVAETEGIRDLVDRKRVALTDRERRLRQLSAREKQLEKLAQLDRLRRLHEELGRSRAKGSKLRSLQSQIVEVELSLADKFRAEAEAKLANERVQIQRLTTDLKEVEVIGRPGAKRVDVALGEVIEFRPDTTMKLWEAQERLRRAQAALDRAVQTKASDRALTERRLELTIAEAQLSLARLREKGKG